MAILDLGLDRLADIIVQWLQGSNVQFLVTPEELSAKAGEVQQRVAALRQDFASIDSRMSAMRSFWQGEAADAHTENYAEITADVDQLLGALNSYAVRLNTIASNYADTEQKVRQELDSLPDDIIQ